MCKESVKHPDSNSGKNIDLRSYICSVPIVAMKPPEAAAGRQFTLQSLPLSVNPLFSDLRALLTRNPSSLSILDGQAIHLSSSQTLVVPIIGKLVDCRKPSKASPLAPKTYLKS